MNKRISQYEFENYVLLPSQRLLLRNGEPIPLKSKVFETLLTLVSHSGQLLTKTELMDKIWSESFVEEGNLTQNIFILRKIFDEKPHDHRFIVTVPGKGYRFVAEVREVYETDVEMESSRNGNSQNGKIKSLAILPLKFLLPSNSAEKEYLGLAISDSLITQLNMNRLISIRPTEAVIKYAETSKDVAAIGRELEVDTVLSGTIQMSGDKVRANLQLHEIETGNTLWASRIEVESNDFFELQDQISKQAALELTGKLNEDLPHRKMPKDNETYQKYVKYRFYWEMRTESGLMTSLEGAKEIVAAEPDFPLGYVCLADAYLLLGHHLFLAPEKVLPKVWSSAKKALELDRSSAEAYATLADYYFVNRDWTQAEKLHQLSIRLKPDYASQRHWYSWFLTAMGRFDEAIEQIEIAQRLDANSLYFGVVRGVPFYYKKEFDLAIKQFQMVLDIDPNHIRARYYLALALFHSGEREKAVDEIVKVAAAEPIQQTMALMGFCCAAAGYSAKAREILQQLDRLEREKYVSPYVRAYVHNGLGETDNALSLLEKAFKENAIWLIWMNIDMNLQNLRDEPRFQKLLQKLNFPN